MLIGKAPGDFALAPAPWTRVVPAVPLGVPSALLQRRPDIASAERQVAAANAQIGIAALGLLPEPDAERIARHRAEPRFADLFSASSALWSLGVSVAQTVFDAGATARARRRRRGRPRRGGRALSADRADRVPGRRGPARERARAGRAGRAASRRRRTPPTRPSSRSSTATAPASSSYTEVVTAQASALSARRALVQLAVNRQVSAITLIQALGGGWRTVEAAYRNTLA